MSTITSRRRLSTSFVKCYLVAGNVDIQHEPDNDVVSSSRAAIVGFGASSKRPKDEVFTSS